jgi:glucosylceramidase
VKFVEAYRQEDITLNNFTTKMKLRLIKSHFMKTGAVRIETKGPWTGNTVAFENPDGSKVAVVANPFKDSRKLSLSDGKETYQFTLEPDSFNTIVL